MRITHQYDSDAGLQLVLYHQLQEAAVASVINVLHRPGRYMAFYIEAAVPSVAEASA